MITAHGMTTVSAELSVGTEMWAIWAYIAIEQADLAQRARETSKAAIEAGEPYDLNPELYAALITIVAVTTSLDAFALLVAKAGADPAAPPGGWPSRAVGIWETLRTGFAVGSQTNTWPAEIKALFKLRNEEGAQHPHTVFGPTADHPVISGVASVRATFTAETATQAVAFLREVYATCGPATRPAQTELASRMSGFQGLLANIAGPQPDPATTS